MQLIGVPICPYCHKRVNMIRVWNLKKHGEYRCPRCRGISNIYLSPLIYVFALIAIAAGFLVYFFARFITESLGLMTILYVFIPFAAFFLLSLFMVYLEKPEIKRVRKTTDGRYFDEDGNELSMRYGKLKPTGRKADYEPEPQNNFIVDDSDSYGREEYYDDYDNYDNGEYYDENSGEEYYDDYDENYDNDYSETYEDDIMTPPSVDLPMPMNDDYDDVSAEDEEAFYAEASRKAKENGTREVGKSFSNRL